MSLLSVFGIHSAKELAARAAAEKAAKEVAAKNALRDAGVDRLKQELAVTPESSVAKILDSYQRAPQLVYSNGSNHGYGMRRDAMQALANKEVFIEDRWEFRPTEEITKIAGSFDAEKLQTLFRTHQQTSGEFSETITHSLVAPLPPGKAIDGLPYHPVMLYDKVAKKRFPIGSWDDLVMATKNLLGNK